MMSELSSDDEEGNSQPGLFTSEEILRQMGFNDSLINKIENENGRNMSDSTLKKLTGGDNESAINESACSSMNDTMLVLESNIDALDSVLLDCSSDALPEVSLLIGQNEFENNLMSMSKEVTASARNLMNDHTYSASKNPPSQLCSSDKVDSFKSSHGVKSCKRKLLNSSSSDNTDPDDPDEYIPNVSDQSSEDEVEPVDGITIGNIEIGDVQSADAVIAPTNTGNHRIDAGTNQDVDPALVPERPKKLRNKNNKEKWKKNENKNKREQGEAYIGYRRAGGGKIIQDVQKEAKCLGPRCTSRLCEVSKLRDCPKITEEERKSLFNNFWKVLTWDQRKMYVVSLVDRKPIKRKRTAAEISRRGETLQYNLVIKGKKVQVCRKTFLNTLGLKKWSVRYWLYGDDKFPAKSELNENKIVPSSKVTRSHSKGKKKKAEPSEYLVSFLRELPKVPSHYCRSTTTKLYLEAFSSITQLFEFYQEECKKDSKEPLSRNTFDQVFQKENFGIFQPKKDQCDICHSFEVGSKMVTEAEYNEHIVEKERAREEKSKDTENSKKNLVHVFTQDTQAVKLAPCVNASAMYYKTKLCVHNFTMYNNKTHDAMTYWWDETESDLSASSFASCVVHNLKETLKEDFKPIIIWSDGCGYQNRSTIMSNALSQLAKEKKVVIEQKYLVKGHTMMECDSVHSTIDTILNPKRSTKNKKTAREIYLPSQYAELTKQARKNPFPYRSSYLDHTFFSDFSVKDTMAYDSIRPGKKVGDPTVHDIRALRYNPDGTVDWKIKFNDGYKALPRRRKEVTVVNFPPLNKSRLKIKKSKWDHLQSLKAHIPADCHAYYDNIPYEAD